MPPAILTVMKMQRRHFLALAGAAALAGCERPRPGNSPPGKSLRVVLYDLKSGQEIGNKTTSPLPQRPGFRIRPHPSFGFIDAANSDVRLIEADNAKVHNLEAGLSGVVWFQPAACLAGAEYKTVLVDLAQNKVVWSNTDHDPSAERVVAGGVVLVPQREGLSALDLSNGKTLWNEKGLGSPSILQASQDQAIVGLFHLNRVEFRNLQSGQLTGKIELPNAGAIPSEAIVLGDLLLLACPRVGIFAYRDAKPIWQVKLKEEQYSPRLLGGDSSVCLLELDSDQEVQALVSNSGKKLWSGPSVRFDGYGFAGGVWVNRFMDLKTHGVELLACAAQTGKSLWKKQLPANQWISVNDRRVAVLSEV